MSSDPSEWENPLLPSWIRDLKPLRSYVGTLTDFARDPANFVRTVISVVLVGGVIDMGESIIAAFLAVGEALVSIPEAVGNLLGAGGEEISTAILDVGRWYVSGVEGVAASMGPFGIFVQVGAYVGVSVLLIRAIPPLLNAGSDALGAVPVVGSLLDAILTFAIDFGAALTDVFGGD